MRIISQDGKVDLPYELVSISTHARNSWQVIARPLTNVDRLFCVMGEYSTDEKAVKAMEMLRGTYIGMPIVMQNVDVSEDMAKAFERLKKCSVVVRADNQPSKVEYINNVIFKFPKDDEIEV